MKRKLKLFSTMSAFALCLAMLVFGVYSASQVNYTASGTVNYEIKDVFVEVSTRVYRSTESTLTDSTKLSTVANALKGATASTLAGVLTAQSIEDTGFGMSKDAQNNDVDDTLLSTYDAENNIIANPESTSTKSVTGIPVEYGLYNATNGTAYAYYVVITVNNIGNKLAGVTVSSDMASATLNSNLVSATNKNVAAQTSANFVYGMSLLDPMTEVDSQDFTITVSISKNEVVEPLDLSTPIALSELNPSQIQQVVQAGEVNAQNQFVVNDNVWFRVGDEVTMTLTNGEEVVLQIADFNHDVDADNNTLPITFVTKYLLNNNHAMNSTASTVGGWPECEMRSYLNNENNSIWSLIPVDWKSVIKTTKKTTMSGGGTGLLTPESSNDKLFILSVNEVGLGWTSYNEEGVLYKIFKEGNGSDAINARTKCKKDGEVEWWFLRSPYSDDVNYFSYVFNQGGYFDHNAAETGGVVFAFCI